MSLYAAGDARLRLITDQDNDALPQADQADDGGRLIGASLALALLRAMPEAAYVMDCDGRVTFINGAGLKHLDRRQAPQRSYLWDLWPEAEAEDLRMAIGEAAQGETVELAGISCPWAGGPAQDCTVSVSPVEDANGQVSKILAIVRAA